MSRRKTLGDRYRVGEVIDQGAFSSVYFCDDMHSKTQYAVKVLNKFKIKKMGMEEAFEREIACLKALKPSNNITNIVEILASGRNYYLIMDLCDGGTLLTMIGRNGGLPSHVLRKYFNQLLSGLQDIHASGVVHRDLKPENLLLDGYRDLRIADFGLAACADDNRVLKRQCGTPHYVAPEVLENTGYNGRKADVWSMGVTLFVMAYGVLPFVAPNTDELYEKVCAGKFTFPQRSLGGQKVAETLQHLIRVCLRVDPSRRYTLAQIARHPWVRGRDTLPSRAVPFTSPTTNTGPSSSILDVGMFPPTPMADAGDEDDRHSQGSEDGVLAFGATPTVGFYTNGSFDEGGSLMDLEALWDSRVQASQSCPAILYKRTKYNGEPLVGLGQSQAREGEGPPDRGERFSLRRKKSSSYYGNSTTSGYDRSSGYGVGMTPRGPKSTSPQNGTTTPVTTAQPKPQGHLWKRLEKEHFVCLLHICAVFHIFLIVGAVRLLFDVHILDWLPQFFRSWIEDVMTPPTLAQGQAPTTPGDDDQLGSARGGPSATPRHTRKPSNLDDVSFDDMDLPSRTPRDIGASSGRGRRASANSGSPKLDHVYPQGGSQGLPRKRSSPSRPCGLSPLPPVPSLLSRRKDRHDGEDGSGGSTSQKKPPAASPSNDDTITTKLLETKASLLYTKDDWKGDMRRKGVHFADEKGDNLKSSLSPKSLSNTMKPEDAEDCFGEICNLNRTGSFSEKKQSEEGEDFVQEEHSDHTPEHSDPMSASATSFTRRTNLKKVASGMSIDSDDGSTDWNAPESPLGRDGSSEDERLQSSAFNPPDVTGRGEGLRRRVGRTEDQ